jgi:hypothetical protein
MARFFSTGAWMMGTLMNDLCDAVEAKLLIAVLQAVGGTPCGIPPYL